MQDVDGALLMEEASKRCTRFLEAHSVAIPGKRFLLAVSGGQDSMCMLYALRNAGAEIAAAHMNYGLRGTDSEADETLVRSVCTAMGIPFFVKRIDLSAMTETMQMSLQEAGRHLRYAWFEELLKTEGFDYLCTAHHMDDSAESFFINVVRGTGLRGLTGIPAQRAYIIRPMLCFTRAEISRIVSECQIPYRDDASNFGADYLRNRIRQQIIPAFVAERPSFITRMWNTTSRLRDENALLQEYIRLLRKTLVTATGDEMHIDRAGLLHTASPHIVLYAFAGTYGFNLHQCADLVAVSHTEVVTYLSPGYTMWLDRAEIVIRPNTTSNDEEIVLGEWPGVYHLPEGVLYIEEISESPVFDDDTNVEYIDLASVKAPLSVRRWRHGDAFYPFGGAGRQKLQDYFTNEKYSLSEKQSALVLTADDKIIWIIGRRLDDRYRITSRTSRVLQLKWHQHST